jgi:hypothetical protein
MERASRERNAIPRGAIDKIRTRCLAGEHDARVLAGSTSDIGFSFRGAGQRSIQNNMTLDGISSSSNLLAMTGMRPIQDAVEEVQVQTGSTSAEYGSFPGVHVKQ